MATRILEYGGWASSDQFPAYPEPLVAQTPIVATATSAQSAAFGTGTAYVMIDSDEDVHALVGTDPTATTSHHKVKAGIPTFLVGGSGKKVAVRTA
mgnify:CR=1 FL=1